MGPTSFETHEYRCSCYLYTYYCCIKQCMLSEICIYVTPNTTSALSASRPPLFYHHDYIYTSMEIHGINATLYQNVCRKKQTSIRGVCVSVAFIHSFVSPFSLGICPSAFQLILQVLHGLVDRIYLPIRPPRHTKLAAQPLDHLPTRARTQRKAGQAGFGKGTQKKNKKRGEETTRKYRSGPSFAFWNSSRTPETSVHLLFREYKPTTISCLPQRFRSQGCEQSRMRSTALLPPPRPPGLALAHHAKSQEQGVCSVAMPTNGSLFCCCACASHVMGLGLSNVVCLRRGFVTYRVICVHHEIIYCSVKMSCSFTHLP